MRLDLFLKSSRLVKRRAIARELCENGKVLVNDRQAKPAKELKEGDVLTLQFSTRIIELEILSVHAGPVRKSLPQELYRIRSDRRVERDSDS